MKCYHPLKEKNLCLRNVTYELLTPRLPIKKKVHTVIGVHLNPKINTVVSLLLFPHWIIEHLLWGRHHRKKCTKCTEWLVFLFFNNSKNSYFLAAFPVRRVLITGQAESWSSNSSRRQKFITIIFITIIIIPIMHMRSYMTCPRFPSQQIVGSWFEPWQFNPCAYTPTSA